MKVTREKRIIDFIKPVPLTASETASKSTKFYFERSNGVRQMNVIVQDSLGMESKIGASWIVIKDSHKHPEFFGHIAGNVNGQTELKNLTLSELNRFLLEFRKVGSKDPLVLNFKRMLSLTQQEKLPRKFESFYIPLDRPSLLFIHPNTVFSPVKMCDKAVRWKAVFKCFLIDQFEFSVDFDDLPSGPFSKSARKYEKQFNLDDVWPLQYKVDPKFTHKKLQQIIVEKLSSNGYVAMELSKKSTLPFVGNMAKYLQRIMKWPQEKTPIDVNLMKSESSLDSKYTHRGRVKHIPTQWGRTNYGHYCKDLKRLFIKIKHVCTNAMTCGIFKVEPGDNVLVTTCEIHVDY